MIVVEELNSFFYHKKGYAWRSVLMVEEKPGETPGRTIAP
jgi:hypothetical protein